MARSTLKTSFPVERTTLRNGLRVVISPDRSSPTVNVAVVYDVGFRSEPENRTGFAHLFEHLMFEGSKNLPKGEHWKLIQGNGGVINGSTRHDTTVYFEAVPSNALEVVLFCEADRMDAVDINEESLRNQIDVVKEEILVNVRNRAYGGFPWIHLPPVMFETFANAHDGYGSFEDLEAATIEDAKDFFKRYYAPGNAILAIAGDVDPAEAIPLIEKHFGRIPKRPVPKLPDFGERVPTSERRATHHDPNAPRPALALGYRVPHAIKAFDGYVASVVLASLLGGGDASRLFERVVKQEQAASHIFSRVASFGWIGTRDPTTLDVMAYVEQTDDIDRVVALVDEELERVTTDVTDEELARVTNDLSSEFFQESDSLIGRTLTMAV
ncbi:MAG: pitrilysin family protein, partial [Actinomycetota bacterium]